MDTMRVVIATEPGCSDRENEDWATATPDMVVVLDGATARIQTGCVHGVAWFANKLGAAIVTEAADHHKSLTDVLATAIRDVAALHPQCDLDHPGTPSAAVGIIRVRDGGFLDVLTLADVTIVARRWSGISVLSDNRVNMIASAERQRALSFDVDDSERDRAFQIMKRAELRFRNQPGGFFVAAADPEVAREAYRETFHLSELRDVALLTDGGAIAVNQLELMTWPAAMDLLAESGPTALIKSVRSAEHADPGMRKWPRAKGSDDATVAYARF